MVISIADVSAWVELNPWMKRAEFMGTSLYNSGTCVKPMFPKVLSEDLMSLVAGQERLAYSLIITFGESIKKSYSINNLNGQPNLDNIDNIDNIEIKLKVLFIDFIIKDLLT